MKIKPVLFMFLFLYFIEMVSIATMLAGTSVAEQKKSKQDFFFHSNEHLCPQWAKVASKCQSAAHFLSCRVSNDSLFPLAESVELFVRPAESIYGLGRVIGENVGTRPMFPVYTWSLLFNTERKLMGIKKT